ncbi:cytochrome b-c1 complex subunit Rieske, mitochondrial [Paracoccidioides brasiliensis]|uniref:Cytochrome b-c1 complex subunit Rieske, mitochondrial n=1 Tax=Paracoccidioides brasiliensis TaxID=121759 RepID=A0A1D2JAT2_PARBR|nr:cytochrome b-c1 complex subunit Rieske, mitochondrial [Paracoccidioides brasiliensis]
MPPLASSSASTLTRACARPLLSSVRRTAAALTSQQQQQQQQQRRGRVTTSTSTTSSFDSPFGQPKDSASTLKIPSFKKYASKGGETSNKVFSYFMAGSMGLLTAVGAKATVHDFLLNMSASADVLAQAKVEIALSAIPEGKNVIIKWRGKPVFIRHRTPSEIQEAESTKWETLRDPQPDSDRVKNPEWLVMLGVCTHLGCVPIGEAGEYGGWFCPCHGSHYDISGRIRKGPAPLNLEIPTYSFPTESTLLIG